MLIRAISISQWLRVLLLAYLQVGRCENLCHFDQKPCKCHVSYWAYDVHSKWLYPWFFFSRWYWASDVFLNFFGVFVWGMNFLECYFACRAIPSRLLACCDSCMVQLIIIQQSSCCRAVWLIGHGWQCDFGDDEEFFFGFGSSDDHISEDENPLSSPTSDYVLLWFLLSYSQRQSAWYPWELPWYECTHSSRRSSYTIYSKVVHLCSTIKTASTVSIWKSCCIVLLWQTPPLLFQYGKLLRCPSNWSSTIVQYNILPPFGNVHRRWLFIQSLTICLIQKFYLNIHKYELCLKYLYS